MLVLSRKPGEKIRIGNDITITLVKVGPNSARIGIDAPPEKHIVRTELVESPAPRPQTGTLKTA